MCLPGLDCLAARTCAPYRTEGQRCGPAFGKCLTHLLCSAELTPGAPTCIAARQPGQSCAAFTLPCAGGSFCLPDAGAALGVCASAAPKGTACTDGFACQSARCLDADAGKACAAACL